MYEIYYGKELRIFVYNPDTAAGQAALNVIREEGHILVNNPETADLALAPLLNKKLLNEEYSSPKYGTLIFHPSLLPRHRGPDAIKWAYRLNESYTGVTWFWCSEGYDEGDICEQEIIPLDTLLRPGEFYEKEVLPALVRSLRRVLQNISRGIIRRVPQYHPAATYESKIKKVQNG
jgi:methionyl-tRNA formyltransferase